MENLVRCKACGYVTRQGAIKDACPACGVPAKMFEPYTDPVSEKRRRILHLDLHPIIVHFPQAFASTLLGLALVYYVAPFAVKDALFYTMKVLSFLLPFFLILSIVTGLIDGKIRFKRVSTLFLKIKIITGVTFFFMSVGMVILAFSDRFPSETLGYFILLTGVAAGCSAVLGIIGSKLLEAKFPG